MKCIKPSDYWQSICHLELRRASPSNNHLCGCHVAEIAGGIIVLKKPREEESVEEADDGKKIIFAKIAWECLFNIEEKIIYIMLRAVCEMSFRYGIIRLELFILSTCPLTFDKGEISIEHKKKNWKKWKNMFLILLKAILIILFCLC